MEPGYWDHNTHYHRWLLGVVPPAVGTAVDVGCGDGLLLQRLAPRCRRVVGLEPDPATAARASARTVGLAHVQVEQVGLLDWEAPDGSVDVVCAVASLHHLDLAAAVSRAARLLRPGGVLPGSVFRRRLLWRYTAVWRTSEGGSRAQRSVAR